MIEPTEPTLPPPPGERLAARWIWAALVAAVLTIGLLAGVANNRGNDLDDVTAERDAARATVSSLRADAADTEAQLDQALSQVGTASRLATNCQAAYAATRDALLIVLDAVAVSIFAVVPILEQAQAGLTAAQPQIQACANSPASGATAAAVGP